MIHVSESAIEWLMRIDLPADRVLRLEPEENEELVLAFGDPKLGDVVIEREGRDLLHVAGALNATVVDGELDCIETPDGPRVALFSSDWDSDEAAETYELPD